MTSTMPFILQQSVLKVQLISHTCRQHKYNGFKMIYTGLITTQRINGTLYMDIDRCIVPIMVDKMYVHTIDLFIYVSFHVSIYLHIHTHESIISIHAYAPTSPSKCNKYKQLHYSIHINIFHLHICICICICIFSVSRPI